MKTYVLSLAQIKDHKPENPERTARKPYGYMGFDMLYQVWPNRKSMAKSIRMQQKRAPRQDDWFACIALSDIEGY